MSKYIALYIPRTEDEVYKSLSKAKQAIDDATPGTLPFSAATIAFIEAYMLVIETAKAERNAALHDQATKSEDFHIYIRTTKKLIRFFISTLNNLIYINKYPINNGFKKEDRTFYELGVEQTTYPKLGTIASVLDWGKKIPTGEINRVTNGGTAIANPTGVEVNGYYQSAFTKHGLQTSSKIVYLAKQKVVSDLTIDGTKAYEEMRDDCKSFFRHLEPEAYRNITVNYGLVFKTRGEDSDLFGNFSGQTLCDDVPLSDVSVRIVEIDMILKSNELGRYASEQVPIGIYTVEYDKEGYGKVTRTNVKISPDIDNIENVSLEIVLE